MNNLLKGLNPSQLQAVTSESKNILCLAGAGTGKTRTLTHRIAYLNDNRVSCTNMLALTFTRLAGKEMKERVINLVGETEGQKLFCNTFHAFCVKVLKEWGHLLGYEKEFTIYDQDDRESIIKAIINELTYDKSVNVKNIISILSDDRELGSGEEDEVIKEYYYRLKRNNAIDLDMLLTETSKLLKQYEQVQKDYHNQYEYVFVDEFQDTNDVQMEIIKALNPKYLFVVGDDFQAIYGWRNAKIDYILNFEKEFEDVEVIKIEENYRCTAPIIAAANKLIKHNINQTEKVLINNRDGVDIEYIVAEDAEDEAQKIAFEIANIEGGYKDFAVLARTNKQLEVLQSTLKKLNIPCEIINNQGDIFKKNDIRMLLNLIQAAINPKDDTLLKKVVNFPVQRLTDIELEKLELEALDNEKYLVNIFEKHPKTSKLINDFKHLMEDDYYHANEIFRSAINGFGLEYMYKAEGRQAKIEDLEHAYNEITRWMNRQSTLGEDRSIFAFIKWLHLKDIQEKLVEEKDTVKLMTVHASKGLEFNSVFVIGMNQNTFPSHRTEDIEEERRLFYVAITRAKNRLYITRPELVSVWGNKSIEAKESQFIQEMM